MKNNEHIDGQWCELQEKVRRHFGKVRRPDLNAILFLIGIQVLGRVNKKFTKEEKQDLMHIAVCRLLSESGHYTFEGVDEEGWPHYSPQKPLPEMTTEEQEKLLKEHTIQYFRKIDF